MYFSAFGKVTAASASACTRRPRLSSVQVSGSKCLPFYKNAHHRIGADANPGGPRLDGICKVYFQTRSDSGVPGRCKIWGDTTEPRMYTCMCSIIFSSHFGVSLQRYLTRFLSGFGSRFPGLAHARCLSPCHPGKVPHVSVPWSRVKEADTEMWLLSVSAAWPPFPRISVTGAQVRIGQWPHCVVKKPLPSGLGPPYRHTLHCTGLPGRQLRLVLCLATRSGRYVPRDSQNSRGAATSTSKDPAGSAIPREGHLPVRG